MIPKKFFLLLIISTLLLVSCRGATGTKEAEATPGAALSPTETVEPTAETLQALGTPAESSSAANCTVVSRTSEADPTQQSLFPAVSDQDWVRGPETAKVTIIEYSDFQ